MCSPRSSPESPRLDSLTRGTPVPTFRGCEPLPLPALRQQPLPSDPISVPYPCPFLGLPLSRDCSPLGTRGLPAPVFPVGIPCSRGSVALWMPPSWGPQSTTGPRSTSSSGISRRPSFPSIRILEIPEPGVQHAEKQLSSSPLPLPGPLNPCHGGDPSGRVGDPWGDAHLTHIVGCYPVPLCPLRVPSRGGTWSQPSSSSDSLLPADFAGSVTWQELGARGRCTSGQHPHGLAMPCQHAQSCLCQMPSGSLTESLDPLAHGSDTAIAARAGIYCQGNQDELLSCDFDIAVN